MLLAAASVGASAAHAVLHIHEAQALPPFPLLRHLHETSRQVA